VADTGSSGLSRPARRAPRLGPDELIAGHITRVGRFRKINPAKGRRLPHFSRVLGFIGWAVLVEESFRRARKASAPSEPAGKEQPPVGGQHSGALR
jgi:hypothetical protein